MSSSISFCTTCSNRLYQLKKTFDKNYRIIEDNINCEWILVNFGSSDNLHEYIMDKLPTLSERFMYVRDLSSKPWHASIAKNLAHKFASNKVVMNLDCDNYISNAIEVIQNSKSNVIHMWSGTS